MKNIFISHSSRDTEYVKCIISLFEAMGINSNNIFCSSIPGYSIMPGADFLDTIRNQLNNDTFVCFIISSNFYMSKMCLCELGAAWVKTLNHTPIIVPPLEYGDLDLLLRNTQCIKINKPTDINTLYLQVKNLFNLEEPNMNIWEMKRDKTLFEIDNLLKKK